MREGKKAENSFPHKKYTENQFFKCFYIKNRMRLGSVRLRISKRFVKLAVKRNRVKRHIREIIKIMRFDGRFDIWVSIRKHPPSDFAEIKSQLMELFSRIK